MSWIEKTSSLSGWNAANAGLPGATAVRVVFDAVALGPGLARERDLAADVGRLVLQVRARGLPARAEEVALDDPGNGRRRARLRDCGADDEPAVRDGRERDGSARLVLLNAVSQRRRQRPHQVHALVRERILRSGAGVDRAAERRGLDGAERRRVRVLHRPAADRSGRAREAHAHGGVEADRDEQRAGVGHGLRLNVSCSADGEHALRELRRALRAGRLDHVEDAGDAVPPRELVLDLEVQDLVRGANLHLVRDPREQAQQHVRREQVGA